MAIAYVDGPRLRRSMLAACEYAQGLRSELNRINVFPVPDGDTGTNLALTAQAISDHLRPNRDRGVSLVAGEAARAAVLGARGNCGMMLSHFLLGFARHVEGRERITTVEFADAMEAGARNLQTAIEKPVEGTILTVIRETAQAATAARMADFRNLMDHLLARARVSLERTPELLPALRKAGVVDAGAKGFVLLIEGVWRYIHGEPIALREEPAGPPVLAVVEAEFSEVHERFRYCTEALVRGQALPAEEEVKDVLRPLGEELIVLRSGDMLKVHLHTDEPERMFAHLRGMGELMAHKAEDMVAQHATIGRSHTTMARRPVGIVTDSACDLPEEVVRAHGIRVVPLMLVEGERSLRDRVDISAEEFVRRLEGEGPLPTTSQPPPGAFLEAFNAAAVDSEELVAVLLGSSLSGTLGSAEAAVSMLQGTPVHVMDSLGASLLTGLLTLKAAELAELAWEPGAIVGELERIRAQSNILFTVDRFDRLLASGRVNRTQAWLGGLLNIKPILGLTPEGHVVPKGKARGRARVLAAMMAALEAEIPAAAERLKFGIVHVGTPEIVEEVRRALRDRWGEVDVLVSPATPVIATHTGIGTWGVAYLLED